MPSYLLQVSYTPEALAAMIKHPQNRAEAVRKPIEKLGGREVGFWFAFGEYDVVSILEMPDDTHAAAFALAAAAGGACRAVKTTPLLSVDEELAALNLAAKSGYKPVK